jgi:type IV pilus biogenesis protein CpaD/CtpE
MNERVLSVFVSWTKISLGVVAAVLVIAVSGCTHRPEMATMAKTDEPRGWLVIEGGSYPVNPVVVEKFES